MRNRLGLVWFVPWVVALVGLAVPMVGSGFIGWPFVVAWLVLLAILWGVRPVAAADRGTRLAAGVAAIVALMALGTIGGFYLAPAVVVWLVLVAVDPTGETSPDPADAENSRHG
jgi:hypothetical protein